ncbi:ABC transporter permease [Pseudomonas serboccidentalis]|uniref:ABC transporter permease n=1 Tax=Pseudomonas serboccidentalis TaxID=2964670 RepID=A0ABY7Z6V0_9PSED|nr:ABC transporter permease [Pseudomonas serboccidentalis]WDR35105.1 ABC transporter permease [Pseudomonas serboccidentalis]
MPQAWPYRPTPNRIHQTGMGTHILMMTIISFLVGLSISGQTFYTFMLENLEKYATLKAIGAKSRERVWMILFTATTGYGLAFGRVRLIAGFSSYPGIRKVLRIEPFGIFGGGGAGRIARW